MSDTDQPMNTTEFPIKPQPLRDSPDSLAADMSVRMWLAGQAMASIMNSGIRNLDASDLTRQEVAKKAFYCADALIAEAAK